MLPLQAHQILSGDGPADSPVDVPAPASVSECYAYREMAAIDPTSMPKPGTRLSFAQIEPWLIERCQGEIFVSVELRDDGYIQILLSSVEIWGRILAAVLPEQEDLRLLGLFLHTIYDHCRPWPDFTLKLKGLDFALFGKDLAENLEEMRDTERARGYHPAIEGGVNLLEGAARQISNHNKVGLTMRPVFTIISDT